MQWGILEIESRLFSFFGTRKPRVSWFETHDALFLQPRVDCLQFSKFNILFQIRPLWSWPFPCLSHKSSRSFIHRFISGTQFKDFLNHCVLRISILLKNSTRQKWQDPTRYKMTNNLRRSPFHVQQNLSFNVLAWKRVNLEAILRQIYRFSGAGHFCTFDKCN